jgi:hypothetical protein
MSATLTTTAPSINTAALPKTPRLDKLRFSAISGPLLFPVLALQVVFFIYLVAYSICLGFINLQLIGLHSVHCKLTGLKNVVLVTNMADLPYLPTPGPELFRSL